MLLYCLNYYYYYLLWRHCDRGWEYEDEWDIVPSIKELCVVVLNAIIVVDYIFPFKNRYIWSESKTIFKIRALWKNPALAIIEENTILWEYWEERIFVSDGTVWRDFLKDALEE